MDNAIGPDGKPRILYLIKLAHAALTRAAERDANLRGGPTGVQLGALFVLAARGPILMKDLAAEIGVNNSAITGLVARMEEAGLVNRAAHDTDGRAVMVAATPKGAKAAAAALPKVRAMNEAALEGFTKAEIAVIARFLTELPARIDARAQPIQQPQNRRPK
jgi:MarR family transcriptional regulator, organic hydroperoxide resistance regulator